jgi:hypothetical protein
VPKQEYQDPNNNVETGIIVTKGTPVGAAVNLTSSINAYNNHPTASLTVHSLTAQKLDNDYFRFTLEYSATAGLSICIFNPPNDDAFKMHGTLTTGEKTILVFDISIEALQWVENVTINFFDDIGNHFLTILPSSLPL